MNLSYVRAYSFLALIFLSDPILAKDNRVDFYIADFEVDVDTSIQLNTSDGSNGTDIDFENTLGLSEDKKTPALTIIYHLGEYVDFEFGYFSLSRSNSLLIDKELVFGDQTFTSGVLSSKFKVAVYQLGINYNFLERARWSVGAGGGLHFTEFDVELTGSALINSENESVSGKINKIAPIPYINASGNYYFTERLFLTAQVDFFKMEMGDFSGSLIDASLGLNFDFNTWVGIGVAYSAYQIKVEAEKLTHADLSSDSAYNYKGPVFFIRAGF